MQSSNFSRLFLCQIFVVLHGLQPIPLDSRYKVVAAVFLAIMKEAMQRRNILLMSINMMSMTSHADQKLKEISHLVALRFLTTRLLRQSCACTILTLLSSVCMRRSRLQLNVDVDYRPLLLNPT